MAIPVRGAGILTVRCPCGIVFRSMQQAVKTAGEAERRLTLAEVLDWLVEDKLVDGARRRRS